jgi:hypothetical protein
VNAEDENETREALDPLLLERENAKSEVMKSSLDILAGRRLPDTPCSTAGALGAAMA